MDEITIYPGKRQGIIQVPWSKSHLHRLIIADFLAGITQSYNSEADDIQATLCCLRALSSSNECPELNCGESGSTLRFLMPVSMIHDRKVRFTGTGRLPLRPLSPFLELLASHGISFQGSSLPLLASGQLMPGVFSLPGNISSQFITGLLFALPVLPQNSRIELSSPLESKGYVDMTLDVLKHYGISITTEANGYGIPGKQHYRCQQKLQPERDWSGAACWIVMNHLNSNVKLEGMSLTSLQPDRAICSLLKKLGTEINVAQCPDIFPILSIAAGAFPGKTTFTGIQRLHLKESDRLAAMADVLFLFGVKTYMNDDIFVVEGIGPHFNGNISIPSFGDHRIAMAAAAGATIAAAPVSIQDYHCVSKSYPNFFEQLLKMAVVQNNDNL